jgi:hypothetical protein
VSSAGPIGTSGTYDRDVYGHRGHALLVILGVGAMVVAACGGDDAGNGSVDTARPADEIPEWPAPDDPIDRTTEAGLTPEVKEHLQTHRHAHLDVFVVGVQR